MAELPPEAKGLRTRRESRGAGQSHRPACRASRTVLCSCFSRNISKLKLEEQNAALSKTMYEANFLKCLLFSVLAEH